MVGRDFEKVLKRVYSELPDSVRLSVAQAMLQAQQNCLKSILHVLASHTADTLAFYISKYWDKKQVKLLSNNVYLITAIYILIFNP